MTLSQECLCFLLKSKCFRRCFFWPHIIHITMLYPPNYWWDSQLLTKAQRSCKECDPWRQKEVEEQQILQGVMCDNQTTSPLPLLSVPCPLRWELVNGHCPSFCFQICSKPLSEITVIKCALDSVPFHFFLLSILHCLYLVCIVHCHIKQHAFHGTPYPLFSSCCSLQEAAPMECCHVACRGAGQCWYMSLGWVVEKRLSTMQEHLQVFLQGSPPLGPPPCPVGGVRWPLARAVSRGTGWQSLQVGGEGSYKFPLGHPGHFAGATLC